MQDHFETLRSLELADGGHAHYYSLPELERSGAGPISQFPVSIRVVLESLLRNCDGEKVEPEDVRCLANWNPVDPVDAEVPFVVSRILLQDFTGVPLLVDLAAMRDAVAKLGKDPSLIEPLVPVDLVVDHSVQVDRAGTSDAFEENVRLEFERNQERYEFLKWGRQAFETFSVVPPAIGIVHQVNLEHLAKVVFEKEVDGGCLLYPDSLVGTDSHTTMINGLGVVGWGVGGIEAEAGMLGQPVYFKTPEVIGVNLEGFLREGVTATDLTLRITEMLRAEQVVGKFVEFHGEGAEALSLADRATIANMAPEYGATMGFFPIDEATLDYLRITGRPRQRIDLIRSYLQAQGLFGMPKAGELSYTKVLKLDLASIAPAVAGPKRPQDRIDLDALKSSFSALMGKPLDEGGFDVSADKRATRVSVGSNGTSDEIGHGSVLIAAITSCTNTSNPSVMIAAGLLAKKAVERGLTVKPSVKTSLAPGSRVVTDYLAETGLQPYLDQLGFQLVGYGCTTCIGNSGPLAPDIEGAIQEGDLVTASVLSGNRNFEARVHGSIKANFLMSPPLVVAYALAGTVDINLAEEPLGMDSDDAPVYLRDLW
ncbi:MAG: aconitate hydratase AcnA, partial [Opitutales bacterium]